MGVVLRLFVLSFLGQFTVHEVSGTCTTSEVQLTHSRLGQSFVVYVTGDDAGGAVEQALKVSPEGVFNFSSSDIDAYHIRFTQGIQVETLRFQIYPSSSIRIRAFQDGSIQPAYDKNLTTGENRWRLWEKAFDIDLSNVVKITITWVTTASELGLKNVAINVCETAPCVPDKTVETNSDLDLPTGFDIHFPGSVLNDGDYDINPFAVLRGSQSEVKLRSLFPGFYPSIKITSPCPFSVSNLKVETKHAKMVILVAFSDITGDEVLFTSSKVIDDIDKWISRGFSSVIGQILNVKRLELYMIHSTNATDPQVFARNLYFNTCK